MAAPRGAHALFTIDATSRFLLVIALVVVVCHALGALFAALGQAAVVGEMLGGILLGPTVFGAVWGHGFHAVFTAEVLGHLQTAANLGLVVFMVVLARELRPSGFGVPRARVGMIAVGATVFPFLVGLAVAVPVRGVLSGDHAHTGVYVLYIGLVLAVTALPVLARLLGDLALSATEIGALALVAAAVGDAAVWSGLTAVLAFTGADGGGGARVAWVLSAAAALVLAAVFVVRPLVRRLAVASRDSTAAARLIGPVLVVGALGFAGYTQAVGLHPVSGAFLFGVIAPRDCPALERLDEQLRGFTEVILLPLFFAGIGLTTSVGLLGASPGRWLAFGVILAAAVGAKALGSAGAARLAGLPGWSAAALGALMNCRGVTELIVIGIGWQYHLISGLGVTVLVLVAIATTAMTPWAVKAALGNRYEAPEGLRERGDRVSLDYV